VRIFITGVAGFIGSHLCDRFLSEGHEVTGMDNLLTGDLANLEHLQDNPRFTFLRQDVSEPITLAQPVDLVLHFASPASPNPTSPYGYPNLPVETLKAGSLGTLHTLEVARTFHASYLLASTSEVYGDPLEHPQKESYWGHVDPIGPRSVYDEAKRFGEALTMAYHRTYGLDTHIARIFNTYGPRMRLDDGRVVPSFVQQALRHEPLSVYGDGSQTRSFCYVEDLVEGVYRLALSAEHDPVNLGNPDEMNILSLAGHINRLAENPAGITLLPEMREAHDPSRRQPNIDRAKRILGWEPNIPLEDGLRRTLAYCKGRVPA
jgi:dTDP-glucose 4,6-dehydratase